MTATQIGIVYSAESKLPRRIIVPDSDHELAHPAHVQPGEAMLRISVMDRHDLASVREHIAKHHGMDAEQIGSGRCALVHPQTQVVEHIIMADPVVDQHPTHAIVASDHAHIGWKHDGRRFLARYVVLDENHVAVDEQWHDASALPIASHETRLLHSATVKIGEKVEHAYTKANPIEPVNVPTTGTVEF